LADVELKYRSVGWVHPSWRDLVIASLSQDAAKRRTFLSRCSIPGVELALSFGGGDEGMREIPLLIDPEDWETFGSRMCELLATCDEDQTLAVLRSLWSVVDVGSSTFEALRLKWRELVRAALESCRTRWDTSELTISRSHLLLYYQLSVYVTPLPESPELQRVWDRALADLDDACDTDNPRPSKIYGLLRELLALISVIRDNEPRFLRSVDLPAALAGVSRSLLESLTGIADILEFDPLTMEGSDVEAVERLADEVTDFGEEVEAVKESLYEARDRILDTFEVAREAHAEREARDWAEQAGFDPDPPDSQSAPNAPPFDVALFFSDL